MKSLDPSESAEYTQEDCNDLTEEMKRYSINEKRFSEISVDEPKKDMDYYLLKDGEVEMEDKYVMFNKWCKEEGVIMPKLEYPAYFENGLEGTRCKEDI